MRVTKGLKLRRKVLFTKSRPCELHGAEKAVEVLLLDEERFKQSARYIFAIGCYYSLSNEVSLARDYVGRAIKMDPSLKKEFAEGSEFDVLWDSF